MVTLDWQKQKINQRAKDAGEKLSLLFTKPSGGRQRFVWIAADQCIHKLVDGYKNVEYVLHTAAKMSAMVERVDTGTSMRPISVASSARTAAAISAAVGPLPPIAVVV